MTDTMRAAWARLRRPLPRPRHTEAIAPPAGGKRPAADFEWAQADTGRLVPLAEYQATRDAYATADDEDDDGPAILRPLSGFDLFLASRYARHGADVRIDDPS